MRLHEPVATSWQPRTLRTPTSSARPWWQIGETVACTLLLLLTAALFLTALVVGQQRQDQRCAEYAGTADACAGYTR